MRENRITPAEALSQAPVSEVITAAPEEVAVFRASDERQREVLTRLEEGVESVLTQEGFAAYLRMVGKFHSYSFNNVILIQAQRPEASLVNSYKRWQELGRQVKKGEKAIKIFYPKKQKIEHPETGEETYVLIGFGIGSVFDLGQTEGEPLPEPPKVTENTGTSDTATAINLKLSRFLIDEGIQLSSEPLHGGKRGYWDPTRRKIAIRASTMVSPLAVGPTRTLVHEAAHFLADHRGKVDRSDAECVAEGSAYATLAHFEVDTGTTSFPYLAGWAKDKEVLRRNLGEIQKVSSAIITAIEGVGDPYADGFGSFEQADPWATVREQMEMERLVDGYVNL